MPVNGVMSFPFSNSEAIVPFLILLTVKASLLLVAAILCLESMRSSTASTRHLICAFTLCGVVLLPLLMLAMPSWRVGTDLLRLAEITSGARPAPSTGAAPGEASWGLGLGLLWLAGIAVCLVRSGAGWLLVRPEHQRSRPLEDPVWQRDLGALAEQFHLNASGLSIRLGPSEFKLRLRRAAPRDSRSGCSPRVESKPSTRGVVA